MKKLYLLIAFATAFILMLFLPFELKLYNPPTPSAISGPFCSDRDIGQEFMLPFPNLSKIQVIFGTYARKNDSKIACKIIQDGVLLTRKVIYAEHLLDNKPHDIGFNPPLEIQPDLPLQVIFETDATHENENFTTFYLFTLNQNRFSHLVVNDVKQEDKDLWIAVYSTKSLWRWLFDTFTAMPLIFQITVLAVLLAILLFTLMVYLYDRTNKGVLCEYSK